MLRFVPGVVCLALGIAGCQSSAPEKPAVRSNASTPAKAGPVEALPPGCDFPTIAGVLRKKVVDVWQLPRGAAEGQTVLLNIVLAPSGDVIDVSVKTGSGNDALDASAIEAVRDAAPFPMPSDRQCYEAIKKMNVVFKTP